MPYIPGTCGYDPQKPSSFFNPCKYRKLRGTLQGRERVRGCPSYSQVMPKVTQCVDSGWRLAVRQVVEIGRSGRLAERTQLDRFQLLYLYLFHQAGELAFFQAQGVLAIACIFSGYVPVGHPAELFVFGGFQDDEKRI